MWIPPKSDDVIYEQPLTQDNLGKHHHHQTQNYTNRRSKAPKKVLRGCVAVQVDIEWRLLESVCV